LSIHTHRRRYRRVYRRTACVKQRTPATTPMQMKSLTCVHHTGPETRPHTGIAKRPFYTRQCKMPYNLRPRPPTKPKRTDPFSCLCHDTLPYEVLRMAAVQRRYSTQPRCQRWPPRHVWAVPRMGKKPQAETSLRHDRTGWKHKEESQAQARINTVSIFGADFTTRGT
jgi:hypothetical protein